MKHLGDITKLDGGAIEIVDVISGGSPCQNFSVAGNREGLAGSQSCLIREQLRIVREMRARDRRNGRTGSFIRPRYMVWENVDGARSSPDRDHKGEDFKAVLEEIIRIAEPNAPDLSVPQKGWSSSGCIYDVLGQWSVAWRVHSAEFWGSTLCDDDGNPIQLGTPQRRKRIALVADYGGLSAPEILFERKGLRGDYSALYDTRKDIADNLEDSVGAADYTLKIRGGRERDSAGRVAGKGPLIQTDLSATLGLNQDQTLFRNGGVAYNISPYDSNGMKSDNPHAGIYKAETTRTLDAMNCAYPACNQGGTMVVEPVCYDARGNGNGEIVPTITGDHENRITDYTALCIGNGQVDQAGCSPLVGALNCMHDQQAVMVRGVDLYNQCETGDVSKTLNSAATDSDHIPCVTYGIDRAAFNQGKNASYPPQFNEEVSAALVSRGPNAVGTEYAVRRLTPEECEILQGYPRGWTNIGDWKDSKGKIHKLADAPRYRALGNSLCLPFWAWLTKRICANYERPATLGSLFDGIGGFPLVWERVNGERTARWASEIEEFPIAVTKIRFKEG